MSITQEELKDWLSYDPLTGLFTWKKKPNRNIVIGRVAGNANRLGYVRIRVYGKEYLAHRLAWLYEFGCFPDSIIDHENGDPSDNRISNLRLATQKQNLRNRGLSSNNTSGYKGVSWHKSRKKWCSYVEINSRTYNLGSYENVEEAAVVSALFRELMHGEFANHGWN